MKKGRRLGELCKLLDLQPYVLRYWITEFPQLGGADSAGTPNRVFSADEVATVRRIQQLLYEEGYTIAGAKKKLESEPTPPATSGRKRTAGAPLFDEGEPVETDDAGSDAERVVDAESIDGKPSAEEAAGGEAPDATSEAPLDTRSDERIETFRREIEAALDEARSILELLRTPRRP